LTAMGCGLVLSLTGQAASASLIFDNFNSSLGHFTSGVANASSGSNLNMGTGTNTRITTDSVDGPGGADQLAIVPVIAGDPMRLRHLSGGGSAANNTAFTTSAAVDGWIGLYAKTSATGFNVQIFIEGASNNGSIPKNVIADGEWHLYEWDLDDNSGGANGWGTISGVIAGVATVADGSHTIDSVIFRNNAFQNSTILMDFVAKTDSGTVAALVPEPATLSLLALGALPLLARRRNRA